MFPPIIFAKSISSHSLKKKKKKVWISITYITAMSFKAIEYVEL